MEVNVDKLVVTVMDFVLEQSEVLEVSELSKLSELSEVPQLVDLDPVH